MAPNNNNQTNNKKKRNKNKKKKASGVAGGAGGGDTGGNNNHNNIPTVATASTTTISMTSENMNAFVEEYKLQGFPKSTYFTVGLNHVSVDQEDLAIDAFQRGATNDGCVACIYFFVDLQRQHNRINIVFPWALEGAIRGHDGCMTQLITIYSLTEPVIASALISYWVKMRIELGDTEFTAEYRKEVKKKIANICCVCGKEDSKDKAFEKCGICKYYSYCGKDCQTYQWK